MLSKLFLLAAALPLALAQATTTASAATSSSTVIVDFSALPSCATNCGPLYDAQGACTPSNPNVAVSNLKTYETCFCAYSTLQPFLTTTAGVCDAACTADSTGLSSIQSWFKNLCKDITTSSSTGAAATAAATGSSTAGTKYVNHNSGSAWFKYHYKWVIMVIILAIGIIAVWVAACLFRKRHIRKKEKEYEMNHGTVVPMGPDGRPNYSAAFIPNPEGGLKGAPLASDKPPKDKKGKARWIVKERT